MKLFAVYLGGRAPRCNTELHDVVFVVGEKIEDTYQQLMEKWFGIADGLHLDSWMELSQVDGFRITLAREKSTNPKKLYFINLGGYIPGEFTEAHANSFVVAESEAEVKSRAKGELLKGLQTVHTDNLYEIDDCLPISEVNGLYVHLKETGERTVLSPNNGYHVIPRALTDVFMGIQSEKRKTVIIR